MELIRATAAITLLFIHSNAKSGLLIMQYRCTWISTLIFLLMT